MSAEALGPTGLRLGQSIEVVCPRFMTFSGRSGINFRSVRPVEVGIAATRGCAVRVRTTCVCARLLRLVVPHHKLPLLSSRAGRYVCAVCVPRNAQFLRVRNGDDDKLREIHRRGLSCSGWVRLIESSGLGPKMEDFNGEFLNDARAKSRRKWPDFRSRRRALQIARAMFPSIQEVRGRAGAGPAGRRAHTQIHTYAQYGAHASTPARQRALEEVLSLPLSRGRWRARRAQRVCVMAPARAHQTLLGAAAELSSRVGASQLLLEASDEPMLHRARAGWTRCLLGGV